MTGQKGLLFRRSKYGSPGSLLRFWGQGPQSVEKGARRLLGMRPFSTPASTSTTNSERSVCAGWAARRRETACLCDARVLCASSVSIQATSSRLDMMRAELDRMRLQLGDLRFPCRTACNCARDVACPQNVVRFASS